MGRSEIFRKDTDRKFRSFISASEHSRHERCKFGAEHHRCAFLCNHLERVFLEIRCEGRTDCIFFPYFVSWVIAYSIVSSLLSVNSGAINQVLVKLGWIKKGFNIIGDPKYSWGLIILINLWKTCGYNTIIFLSSIAGIPTELYEASALDGAGRLQQIRYVTLPSLLPTASVLLIMNAGWILNSNLEQFFVFQNATNWTRMEVLDMYIYKFGLKMLDFPYATAMSIVKTLVSILMLLAVNALTKKLNKVSVI